MNRRPILQSAHLAIHKAPRCFLSREVRLDVGVGSTARKSYASNPLRGQEVSSVIGLHSYLSGIATSPSHERTRSAPLVRARGALTIYFSVIYKMLSFGYLIACVFCLASRL